MAAGSIDIFLQTIAGAGGMSFSNNWDIEFRVPDGANDSGIGGVLGDYITKGQKEEQIIRLLCDEAQLPNVNSATGTINGRYLGSGSVNYAHTRVYSDLQLGWMCDADMTPLKFLTEWNDFIFGTSPEKLYNTKYELTKLKGRIPTGKNIGKNRSIRVRYPDDYMMDIIITKTEISPNAPNGRPPIAYYIEQAFPYAIDAVPLSYGASQITKVTASFYYARHHTYIIDTKNEPSASVRNKETANGSGNLSDAQTSTGAADLAGANSGIA